LAIANGKQDGVNVEGILRLPERPQEVHLMTTRIEPQKRLALSGARTQKIAPHHVVGALNV
jgi:hypothetical protein